MSRLSPDGKGLISDGEWHTDPVKGALVRVRYGALILAGDHPAPEDIDVELPWNDVKTLLKYIQENYPEMITSYKGRDVEDIKIINRLIDVIQIGVKE